MTDYVFRIITLLDENGITGVRLGKLLGLEKSPVTDWKNEKSKPTLEQIITICENFAISADYLLFGRSITDTTDADMSKDERFLLRYYAQLSEDDQADVLKDVAARAQRSAIQRPAVAAKGVGQAAVPAGEPAPTKIAKTKAPPGPGNMQQKKAQ